MSLRLISPWRRMLLMDGVLGLLLMCCCLGALWVPAFLMVTIHFPPHEARVTGDTLLVRITAYAQQSQVVLSEGGPNTYTPPHRLWLDDRLVWDAWEEPALRRVVVLEDLTPGPHTLRLEARAGRRQVQHQVTFTVEPGPGAWQVQRAAFDAAEPLFWASDGAPVYATVEWWLEVRVPARWQTWLEPYRRAFWLYLAADGTRAVVLPNGERRVLPDTARVTLLAPKVQPVTAPRGWYRAADFSLEGNQVRFVARGYGSSGRREVVPPFAAAYAFAGPAGVFFGHDPGALEPLYMLQWGPEPRLVPAPVARGVLVGPGVWRSGARLWWWRDDAWQALPLLPAEVAPEAVRRVLVETQLWAEPLLFQARPCGPALWVSAAWWGFAGEPWSYPALARYAQGRWEAVPPPTPYGAFALYCFGETVRLVNLRAGDDTWTAGQAMSWGWPWWNRPDWASWKGQQGLGRTYRWDGAAWVEEPVPPYVGPAWDTLPHPAGLVFRFDDGDAVQRWYVIPAWP